MATLTKSTGTAVLSGAAEKVTLPASYGWVWVKNMSDSDIFAGVSADISEGADGVMTIPAGECGRVQTDGFSSIYLLGTGNALVVAQNYADCPFKVGGKGGESPDLSEYAKKADVPNIKVNEAVNADTVGGHSVNADVPAGAVFTDTVPDLSAYAKKTDIPTALPADGGNADYAAVAHDTQLFNGKPYSNYVNYLGVLDVNDLSAVAADVYEYVNESTYKLSYEISINPTVAEFVGLPHNMWWHIKYYAYGYGNGFSCQTAFPVGFGGVPYIRYSQEGVWSDWKEFYTSGNKPYITGSATVAANTNVCVSNHGFTPSAVIWWDGNSSGVAVSFNDTQFVMNMAQTDDRTVNYLIFK